MTEAVLDLPARAARSADLDDRAAEPEAVADMDHVLGDAPHREVRSEGARLAEQREPGRFAAVVGQRGVAQPALAPVREQLSGQIVISDWKAMNSALFEALQVERVAMFFALSFMVVVASFNILSSLVMLVRAKTRDIAIMRTMGATRRSLLKIFVTTGTTIGVIGTGTGLLLGAVILFFREQIVSFIALVTGQQIWDPEVRFLSALPARTDPWEVVGIVCLALAMSFLATLYPALKAANTDPVQVLRYE